MLIVILVDHHLIDQEHKQIDQTERYGCPFQAIGKNIYQKQVQNNLKHQSEKWCRHLHFEVADLE